MQIRKRFDLSEWNKTRSKVPGYTNPMLGKKRPDLAERNKLRPKPEDLGYYVYEHYRPGETVPFYVGRGTGRRYKKRTYRNAQYQLVCDELLQKGKDREARIIYKNLTKEFAASAEIMRISFWRASGVALTNSGDGGFFDKNKGKGRKRASEIVEKTMSKLRGRRNIAISIAAKLRWAKYWGA